jgi:hypothetical protein
VPVSIRPTKSRPDAARLITLQQGSAEFGPPYNSLRDLTIRGVLPCVKFPGSRRIWIKRADLEALIVSSTERGVR